jgi:16S rRNA (cytidine1402-2'-O)-methyltransferase
MPSTEEEGPVADAVVRRTAAELARHLARPLPPGLHLVATPIGNLGDITLRAIAVLAGADAIYCEDTRVSRTLLAHFAIPGRPRYYYEHNAEAERPRILEALKAGRSIALISDAGTPLVSDPGYKLVRAAIDAGHPVTILPGASAALAALAVSGLPTDTFLFAGFLPPKAGARRTRLLEFANTSATLIVFEAPSRVTGTLAAMAEVFGEDRPAVLARELTKLHETVARGTLAELAATVTADPPRGEIVLVVAPPPPAVISDEMIAERMQQELRQSSLRDAASRVAEALGVARSRVYDIGLKVRRAD